MPASLSATLSVILSILLSVSFTLRAQTADKIKWVTLDAAMDQARADDKKIMIFIYTDWCGWCKIMEKNTFSDPEIVKYINAKYCPVKLNAWTKENIWFMGYKFSWMEEQNAHQLAYQLLDGKLKYPSVVFLNRNAEILSPVQGYVAPATFNKYIRYFGDDVYLKTTWDNFKDVK